MPRILVIVDDLKLRTAIRRMLESAGYEIEEASDGRDGLRKIRTRPFDLVLCDMFMPEHDSLDLVRELSREFPGTKIISMSGGGFDGSVDMLPIVRRLGAAAIVYKPFEKAELLGPVDV